MGEDRKKGCVTTVVLGFFVLWCIGQFSDTKEEKVPLYNDIDAVVEKAGYVIQDNMNDPESYSFKDIYPLKTQNGGKEFVIEYREKNVFGGMIINRARFYCGEDTLILESMN